MLRKTWYSLFYAPWIVSLIILFLVSIPRTKGMLGASGFNGLPVMLGFVAMWFLPILFLDKAGRREIGIRLPTNAIWVVASPIIGLFAAFVTFVIGYALFSTSADNWFVSVGHTFFSDPNIFQLSTAMAFTIITLPAMLFSPIGEELLFRGIIYESFKRRWDHATGAAVSASLFAGVHLLHHGIIRTATGFDFLWLSGLLWFLLMFACSYLFLMVRLKTGSIWASVLCHSFFNLGMNITIFIFLKDSLA